MKILHVIPAYKPATAYGGPTQSVADLCQALAGMGHDVHVYATKANGNEELNVEAQKVYNVDGVKVLYHNRWTKDQSNFSPSLLSRFWKEARSYDAIHLHAWWNMVTIPCLAICTVKGIRPVLSVRGTLSAFSFSHKNQGIKTWFHVFIGKRLLRSCVLHVTSDKEREELIPVTNNPSIKVIPNINYFPAPATVSSNGQDKFRVIFLGRINPVKNLPFLIDLFKSDLGFPAELQIFGEGEQAFVDDLRGISNSSGNIEWKGRIEGEAKWNEIRNADLLVLPSQTENFGNVVIEALSQGTPVLVSDAVGLKEFIREHRMGWVSPVEKDAWVNALKSIWSDVTSRERIRKEGPKVIAENFHATQLAESYLHMYSELSQQ